MQVTVELVEFHRSDCCCVCDCDCVCVLCEPLRGYHTVVVICTQSNGMECEEIDSLTKCYLPHLART